MTANLLKKVATGAAGKPHGRIQRRVTDGVPNFDEMPDSAMVRKRDLVRDPRRPTRATVLPFSGSTLERKVAAGEFPPGVLLGTKTRAWTVGSVRGWLTEQTQGAMA